MSVTPGSGDFAPLPSVEQARPQVHFGVKSIPSEARPDRNEDAALRFQKDDGTIVAAVFDGSSPKTGAQQGDVASRMALDIVNKQLLYMFDGLPLSSREGDNILTNMQKALNEANRSIGEKAGDGVASSAAVLVARDALHGAQEGDKDVAIATVGDCRVYVLSDGKLSLITLDDTKVREGRDEIKARELQGRLDSAVKESDLSPDELEIFNARKKITQALDGGQITPRFLTVHLSPGDRVFLTTNAIPNNLIFDEIQAVLATNPSAGMAMDELIARSMARARLAVSPTNIRSNMDDMTGVVFDIPKPAALNQDKTVAQKQAKLVPFGDRFPAGTRTAFDGKYWVSTGERNELGDLLFRSEDGRVAQRLDAATLQAKGAIPFEPQAKSMDVWDTRTKPSDIVDVDFGTGTREERREKLYDVVRRLQGGGLQGSKEFFPSLKLLSKLQVALDNPTKTNVEEITNGEGSHLRQKLIDLIEIERAEDALRRS